MARIKLNSIASGLRGSIGELTFRKVGNQTIASGKPTKARKQSALQRKNRAKFKEACRYVKVAMKDPALKAHYLQVARAVGLTNAHIAAVSEYLREGKLVDLHSAEEAAQASKQVRKKSRDTEFKLALLYGNGNAVELELPLSKEIQLLFHKAFKNTKTKKPVTIRLSRGDEAIYLTSK